MYSLFAEIPFLDRERAETDLTPFLSSGRAGLPEQVAVILRNSPDPQRTVLALSRFLEAVTNTDAVLDRMLKKPEFLRRIAAIFSQSHFLSDVLYRNPGHADWLCDSVSLGHTRSADEMRADMAGFDGMNDGVAAQCLAMRRFQQRELLRIALRDVYAHASLASVTEDLSNLADAMLDTAILAARSELDERYGRPMAQSSDRESTFVVLAMGKLGGRELNFSSDIDLLFIYSDEGNTEGGRQRSVDNVEYFKKLGERVIKILSEQTAEGFLFRVDMRLRPFGRSGPLASSFDAALEYYATYGRAWERQAMIKARACAGHIATGQAFIDRIRSFVFPKYFDDATLEDIRNTKQQTEMQIARQGLAEYEVKLGPGGIRDIEFTVQMLQLLNGGRWPELRTTNTLKAIEVLEQCDSLTHFESEALVRNYQFLRHVEHRIQIEDGRQCHAMPSDPALLDDLARRLGYADHDVFLGHYRTRTHETRKILERFLAAKGGGNLWVGDLLNPFSDGEAGLAKLVELGFLDAKRGRAELLTLAAGDEAHPFLRHVHQQFTAIAPFLLEALAQTAHPDAALTRLAQVMVKIKAPGALYELLRADPGLCEYLVMLADNSEYLCRTLIRDPGLFDLLTDAEALDVASSPLSLKRQLSALKEAVASQAALYRLRDGEMLRVAMRELGHRISVAEVGDELTQLAEIVLEEALQLAREKVAARSGPCTIPFAILGLGKFGGWEMGYGSDLDLLFVYEGGRADEMEMAPSEYFAAMASHTLKILKEPSSYGLLYDIDARLRPDGNKGVLAIDHETLEDYFRQDAQPWERLALMKVRAVAGERGFAMRAERIAKEVAFSERLDRPALEHINDLRRRAQAQTSVLDLKRWEGGISDIEFATRFLQLRHAADWPELKRGDVLGALDIMRDYELADRDLCQTLRRAYPELRRILNRIRMMDGGKSMLMPAEEAAQADLAARLGIEGRLIDYVDERRHKVAEIYNRVLQEALESADA